MPTAFHLGFQVRVELILADGAPLTAQITRDEEELLELDRYRSSTCARTARARSAASRKGYCDVQASGGAASARTSSGSRAAARSAIVVRSSTLRRLARTAIQSSGKHAAEPEYRSVSGRCPRTFASGPSTARITSAGVISPGGRASQ